MKIALNSYSKITLHTVKVRRIHISVQLLVVQ